MAPVQQVSERATTLSIPTIVAIVEGAILFCLVVRLLFKMRKGSKGGSRNGGYGNGYSGGSNGWHR